MELAEEPKKVQFFSKQRIRLTVLVLLFFIVCAIVGLVSYRQLGGSFNPDDVVEKLRFLSSDQ